MGKRIARKAPPTAPTAPGKVCARCGIRMPLDAFDQSATLADGLSVWCRECAATLAGGSAELLRAYQRDYNREYQRARRHRLGPAYELATAIVPGRGTIRLRWSRARNEVKATGRWELLEEARRILVEAFGACAGDVAERGRGGGTGRSRQSRFFSTAPASEVAWQSGVAKLMAARMLSERGGA